MDALEYKAYCKEFKSVERYLRKYGASQDIVNYNICNLRGYRLEQMNDILTEAGFIYIEDNSVYDALEGNVPEELGLFKNGQFLLSGRFIFPVRDMLGNTLAMIGWFPDEKKYITTPSKLFSKSCLFYGMEQLGTTGIGCKYYLVEGIFDCLSVRSLGINAVANMGVIHSRVKGELYALFNRLVGVPDADSVGRAVVVEDKWKLRSCDNYLRWTGDSSIKDIDDLVKTYDPVELKTELLSALNTSSDERVLTIEL